MPEFYSEYNVREHFSAPQLTRVRHRYRGPRESEKINLELDQLLFSITRLYEKYRAVNSEFVSDAQILIEGGELSIENDDATPSNVTVEGLNNLAARIEGLRKRLKAQEK